MYLLFKLIHVLGVIAFVGNIVTGALWMMFADHAGDPKIIAQTARTITRLDYIITIPAIAVLLIGGFGAANEAQLPILGTGWILWGLVLFIVSGICFIPISIYQRRMEAVAGAAGSFDRPLYRRSLVAWSAWGIVGTLAPLAAVVVMVLKPVLPAL